MYHECFHDKSHLPFVSFIIPTYNAEKTLDACLDSIFAQEYPKDKFEVLVIDGGSTDSTANIIKKYPTKMLNNPIRVEDGPYGGKAIGVNSAQGEFLAFVDADNILTSNNWLKKMIQPFIDEPEIVACETSKFAKKSDHAINRYCSSLVVHTPQGDPFSLSYRKSIVYLKKRKDYVVYMTSKNPPYIANGTIIMKNMVEELGGFDYDADLAFRMTMKGYTKFAKVLSVGIYHQYVPNLNAFIKKAIHRFRHFLYFSSNRKHSLSHYLPLGRYERIELLRNVLSSFSLIVPTIYAIKKSREDRDTAWLYHPILLFLRFPILTIILLTSRKGITLLFQAIKPH